MERKINCITRTCQKYFSRKEAQEIRGGDSVYCGCACAYANSGGSSDAGNCGANYEGGLKSPGYADDEFVCSVYESAKGKVKFKNPE
jgi:hypothetical protein